MVRRLLRAPLTWVLAVLLAAGAAFGLYWFQPWKLFTDTEVREQLPAVAEAVPSDAPAASTPAPDAPVRSAPAANTLLAAGRFITHEHETTGGVQLIRRADGKVQLVLRDLATSDGPDLRVWLTDQPVREGRAGWKVFDDGEWVEVGRLKGNRGDQVYDVPAAVDLGGLRSVSIWCKRFSVSFGAAALTP
jgi:hypothetical protein